MMKENKIGNICFSIFATTCMFFYLYQANLTFLGLPFISSSVQLSWILMALYATIVTLLESKKEYYRGVRTYKNWKKHVSIFILLFFYSIFLLLSVGKGDGMNISEEVLKIFIYGISMFWIWSKMFHDIEGLMKILFYTGVIQTIIVYLCLIYPHFALILDATVNFNPDPFSNHITSELRSGYAGGIGCITSSGLVRYTLSGLIPCVYFCINKPKWYYYAVFLIMALCATMLARTGLIFDIILVLYIIIKKLNSKSTIPIVVSIIAAAITIYIFFNSPKYSQFIEERFFRYEALKNGGGRGFFEAYFWGQNALYPPIKYDTFWGVGVTSGVSANGYYVNVDGGAMRLYSAIGILCCILFYTLVIRNQIMTIRAIKISDSRHILWLYLLCLCISEWKEVTFMTFWPLTLFFFIGYLLSCNDNNRYSKI